MAYNEANDRSVTMQEYVLKKVTKFKHLGSTMSEDGRGGREEDTDRLEKLEEDVWCPL